MLNHSLVNEHAVNETEAEIDSENSAEFYRDTARDDDLAMVMRISIHIEDQITRLIEQTVVDAKAVRNMRLEYEQRVHLAIALGLDAAFVPALKALGSIRNKFAHTLKASISDEDANNLYRALDPFTKRVLHDRYKKVFATRFPDQSVGKFDELGARDRVVIIAVTMRAALLAARNLQAKHAEGQ